MTVVRINQNYDLLKSQYDEFARLVLNYDSFEIKSVSKENIEYFVNSFFDNYYLRTKYLKQNKDKFIFINLENFTGEPHSLDTQVLEKVSNLFGIQFNDLNSLYNFLENQDAYLTILYSIEDEYSLRFLLSYSFLLKQRFILILSNSLETNYFEKRFNLEFSDAFINFFLGETLSAIGFDKEELNIKEFQINGDLSKVPEFLHLNLSNLLQPIEDGEEINVLELPVKEASEKTSPTLESIQEKIEELQIVIPDKEQHIDLEELEQKIVSAPENPQQTTQNLEEFTKEPSLENLNLTLREENIYSALLSKKFLTRLELAIIAWGEEEGPNAKDDAIDQVVSRLRRKFVKAGYSKEYIYSKKGEGVGLNS